MYIYSMFMYMLETLKADHWRPGTGTPSSHIVAGAKAPETISPSWRGPTNSIISRFFSALTRSYLRRPISPSSGFF